MASLDAVFKVCVLHTNRDFFDYTAPLDGTSPCIGARVQVPFRNQIRVGIVIGYGSAEQVNLTLKPIIAIVDETPLLSAEALNLYQWVSTYYQSPLSEVLALALPKRYRELKAPMTKKNVFSSTPTQTKPLNLHPEQTNAVNLISDQLNHYHCFLLQGITGSGKTEVYLQVIAKVLAQGQQALVIVPEIGLTPQLLERFTARFQTNIVVLHSKLSEGKRQLAWQAASQGTAKLLIGTRTAIFTPMPLLGLIVIDEEHDPSLKQADGVKYSARDTALIRARTCNIPIILGSATPSLESLYNCQTNKYNLLQLNQRALSQTPLHYQMIDIRNQSLQQGLSSQALKQITLHLSRQNQVLVFINRRGYSPVLLCHQCGWIADCQACDAHLTLHRQLGQLICHHCGLTQIAPHSCVECHGTDLVPVGSGTQRLYEYLSDCFPQASLLRVDSDAVSKKGSLEAQLEQIHRGDAQLLVGTQMLAKGHHFPKLTLVVIVDADGGFYHQDFRATERLGQLLVQVAGRAGRAESPGEVLIQTHLPQHPLLNTLIQQGYDAFAQLLLKERQQAGLPPYQYLALIRAQHKTAGKVLSFLHVIKKQLETEGLLVLGPAPGLLARKANQHRLQLLIKSSSRKTLHLALWELREWLANNKIPPIRWSIDIDPIDLS